MEYGPTCRMSSLHAEWHPKALLWTTRPNTTGSCVQVHPHFPFPLFAPWVPVTVAPSTATKTQTLRSDLLTCWHAVSSASHKTHQGSPHCIQASAQSSPMPAPGTPARPHHSTHLKSHHFQHRQRILEQHGVGAPAISSLENLSITYSGPSVSQFHTCGFNQEQTT